MFNKAIFSAVFTAALASAHSWLECTKVTSVTSDQSVIQNVYSPMQIGCEGYPRNKVNNGDWIAESTLYTWDLFANNQGGKVDPPACNPRQTLNYPGNVPMATAKAGETLKMRRWGNGHSEWAHANPHRDPGLVRVYWAGAKETEIKLASELVDDWKIAEANFTQKAIIVDDNASNTKRNERANFLEVTLPKDMENGRHMMVWAWAWVKDDFSGGWRNQFTTCFDIEITGGSDAPRNPAEIRKPITAAASDDQAGPVANVASTTSNSISPKCSQTCFKGGVKDWPCTGAHCPSCRYQSGDDINCFDKLADGSCPFSKGYDCSTGNSI